MSFIFHKKQGKILVYLAPLFLLCFYAFIRALNYDLHDFLNSYLPALLAQTDIPLEKVIFDIYDFNKYAWDLGYTEALLDYYLNSPFTPTAFYPLSFIKDPYLAKAIFNIISIFLFLSAMYQLSVHYLKDRFWVLLLLPILFYIPIRNNILFGQSYFLIFFLVVTGYFLVLKQKNVSAGGFLAFAFLLKFFPVFYGLPLLIKGRWRPILWGALATICFIGISIYITEDSLWIHYFSEVLPTALQNGTTIGFRSNYQSFDVFLKTLFVQDAYYNPTVLLDNEKIYQGGLWIIKAVIVGAAGFLSIKRKDNILELLAIWIVALFLLQSRTATYAQILWCIPLFAIYTSTLKQRWKIIFYISLLLCCNIPYHALTGTPIIFRFLRLWLTLLLGVIFYLSMSKKIDYRYILVAFILFLPLNTKVFATTKFDESTYVLPIKKHFMVCDYNNTDGMLTYKALGKNGLETIPTEIPITAFKPECCVIKDNQIYIDGTQITFNAAQKKKAVLVNDCDVYFLSDHRSRHGAFTLKKMTICPIKN